MAHNVDKACTYCDAKSAEIERLKQRIIELEQLLARHETAVRNSSKRTDMAGEKIVRAAAELRSAIGSAAPSQNKAPDNVAQAKLIDPDHSAASLLFEQGILIAKLYEQAQQVTKLPQLSHLRAAYIEFAISAGVMKSVAENDEFLNALHLGARELVMQKNAPAGQKENLLWQRRIDVVNDAKQRLLSLDWPKLLESLNEQLSLHSVHLSRNLRRAYILNEYGAAVKDDRWREVERFLESVGLIDRARKHGLSKVKEYIIDWYEVQKTKLEHSQAMPEDGNDFEHWVAAQLSKHGWTATVTQASGDDGVDIVAIKNSVRVAVQCKRYAGSVGNKAVQEVYTGMKHMQLDHAVVISTGKYTKAAQDLARTTGVFLLSEHDIHDLFDLLGK
jgi:hypothetical protein